MMNPATVDAMVKALRAKLAEMPDHVVKTYGAVVKKVDAAMNRVEATISTPMIDRDHEVVLPSAFKGTKGQKFPLVNSHDYGDITNQIGSLTITKIHDEGVDATIEYLAGRGNDAADWGMVLASEGLGKYSIGFRPKPNGYKDADLEDEEIVRDILAGKIPMRTYTAIDLYETSQVVVPSNPGAVQHMVSKGVYTAEEATAIEAMIDASEKKTIPEVIDPVKDILDVFKTPEDVEVKSTWKVGGARGLPLSNDSSWDGSAAEASLASYAGIGGDRPNWRTYRRGFVVYDSSDPEKKGSYKLPFARFSGGRLVASKSGLQAVRQRLSGTDIPETVRAAAARFVNSYLGAPEKGEKDGAVIKSVMTLSTNPMLNGVEPAVDEVVLRNDDDIVIWRGTPVDLEDLVAAPKSVRVEVDIHDESLRKAFDGFTKQLTSALEEVTTSIRDAVAKLPTVPAYIAEYPKPEALAQVVGEIVARHARRIAREEVGKVTGDVDTFLK